MAQQSRTTGTRSMAARISMAFSIRPLIALGLCAAIISPRPAAAMMPGPGLSALTAVSVTSFQTQDDDGFSHMTFRQRERLARRVYRQAEGHHRRGQLKAAIRKYEQTYRLVPNKHGLAFIIGMAYKQVGECQLAGQFLERLIKHGGTTPEFSDKVDRAHTILGELREQGCYDGDIGGSGAQEEEAPMLEDPEDEPEPEPEPEVEDEYEEEEEEEEEPAAPVYDGPTVDQASLDENPLGISSEAARKKNDKAFRRANSRGFLISGIIISSLGAVVLGGAGFLHWKSQDTAKSLLRLTDADNTTRFPTTHFSCQDIPKNELSSRCPRTLIKDFQFYRQYTPIAYGVGGGLVGLGLTFILIKQIRMAKYRRRAAGKMSWTHPERLNLSPYRVGTRLGAQATLRF